MSAVDDFAKVMGDIAKRLNKLEDDVATLKGTKASQVVHASDCAVHNMPAYPAGPCDCGATK